MNVELRPHQKDDCCTLRVDTFPEFNLRRASKFCGNAGGGLAGWGGLPWRDVPVYIGAQITGAFAGVATAHLMFALPLFSTARNVRASIPEIFSEFVATFGLLFVICGCVRFRTQAVPFAVAA